MSHGLPEQIHVVKFSSNGEERFIIGKLINKGNLINLVDDQGTNSTAYIIDFENTGMNNDNDYRIITSEGKIGPMKVDTQFQFKHVVGIGSREIMSPGLPEPEQIHVVQFATIGGWERTLQIRFIIGKIIKLNDRVNLNNGTLTARITEFENFTWDKQGNDYRIVTSEGKIGPLVKGDIPFQFENVDGIGSRDIMLSPADPADYDAAVAVYAAANAPANAPATTTAAAAGGSKNAPKKMDKKRAGKKTRRRRINRRRKSQKKMR